MPPQSPETPPSRPCLGLVAGGGDFPFQVARGARKQGYLVACVGIRHEVSPDLADEVETFKLLSVGRLNAALHFFKAAGARKVSWAGWIRKDRLFTPRRILSLLPDWRLIRFWFVTLKDHQSQTILSGLADEFAKEGLTLTHSAEFCPELLVTEGVLTRREPSRRQLDDIRFGWHVAKRIADLDVGQSVAVHDKATIAVEGIEGTDQNILRAGQLCRRGGFTVVKVAKEGHDMRFDVPAVGPRTIESLHQARGAVLALEAHRTLLLERETTIELANRYKIVIAAYTHPPE